MNRKYNNRLQIYLFNINPQYDRAGYVSEFSNNFNNVFSVSAGTHIKFVNKLNNYDSSRFNFVNKLDGYTYSTDSCVVLLD